MKKRVVLNSSESDLSEKEDFEKKRKKNCKKKKDEASEEIKTEDKAELKKYDNGKSPLQLVLNPSVDDKKLFFKASSVGGVFNVIIR